METGAVTSSASSSAPVRRGLRATKSRRRQRLQAMPVSLAIVGVMGLSLMSFGRVQQRWASDSAAWKETGTTLVDDAPGISNYGFGDLGRSLSEASMPPAPPPPCPAPSAANSTYPPLNIEPQAAATFVQLAIMLWMFLGLAIVCDQFFESALTRICEAMNLKDDVAGATWMAAGGSAPELATSILGVFVSRSDVGIGTIVGSAVFNVLFVIACCAFVAPDLKLTWWPLARDSSFYCFSMAILVFVLSDTKVWFWEAVILLLLYALYVTIMYYNEQLEAWVTSRVRASDKPGNPLQQKVISILSGNVFGIILYTTIFANAAMVVLEFVDDAERDKDLPCVCGEREGKAVFCESVYCWLNFAFNLFFIQEMLIKWYAHGFFGYWRQPLNCFDGSLVFLIIIELVLSVVGQEGVGIAAARSLRVLRFMRGARFLRLIRLWHLFTSNKVQPAGEEKPQKEEEKAEEEEEEEDDEPFNPFEIPESAVEKFFWIVGFPLALAFYFTIPDCRREMFKKWWAITFLNCILWIMLLAYFMVWMVTEFGQDVGIPDTVMGVTLLAAGTSIPDALSSVAVARRGHGDMAVSSSIGSNVFDILIGLPIPWFVYGAILRPALGPEIGPDYVPIESDALAVMILSLFVMVALVVTTIHISGWRLSVKLGGMMMALYGVFLLLCLLLEYDVLLAPCDSD
mmetsp:Transcript_34991/g.91894  ORF Transcript_34991/g.91894 Transcript_34991/m.91894 type:complete len:685 (+) Transcript_34991:86-2140(+)